MQIKKVSLRRLLTTRVLRFHLFDFFRKNTYNSNFLYVLTKITTDNGKTSFTLGKKSLIDITKKGEVKTYINHVTQYFFSLQDQYSPQQNDKILIYYIESNEEVYKKYLQNIILSKNFDGNDLIEDLINPIHNVNTKKNFYNRMNKNNLGNRLYSTLRNNFLIKTFKLNKWYEFRFSLQGNIILAQHIEVALREFWLKVVDYLDENYYIVIQFKLLTVDNEYRSISYLQTVNKNDLNRLTNNFIEYWLLRTDEYHQMAIDSIIFDYKLYQKSVKYAETNINKHQKVIIQQNKPIVFGGYKLPTNMDITTWSGNVKFFSDYTKAIVYLSDSKREYHIQLFNDYQIVQVKVDEDILLEFKDILEDRNDLSTFTRIIKDQKYISCLKEVKLVKLVK